MSDSDPSDEAFVIVDREEEVTDFVLVEEAEPVETDGVDLVTVEDPERRYPGIDRVYQRPSN